MNVIVLYGGRKRRLGKGEKGNLVMCYILFVHDVVICIIHYFVENSKKMTSCVMIEDVITNEFIL